MKHVIVLQQLLGDGLMVTPAIRALRKSIPRQDSVELVLAPDQFNEIHLTNPSVDIVSAWSPRIQEIRDRFEQHKLEQGSWFFVGDDRYLVPDSDVVRAYKHQRLPDGRVPHKALCYARQFDVKLDSLHYEVRLTDEELAWGEAWVKSNAQGKKLAVCAALSFSGQRDRARKMLAPEIWQSVVDELAEVKFVFLASAQERIEPITAQWLQGEKIRKVAAICRAADVVVSIDTGIGHLAAAVDANIVSIAAPVVSSFSSVSHTLGKYCCLNHSKDSNRARLELGMSNVKAGEIIEAVRLIVG